MSKKKSQPSPLIAVHEPDEDLRQVNFRAPAAAHREFQRLAAERDSVRVAS
jgi:hypothetical protein